MSNRESGRFFPESTYISPLRPPDIGERGGSNFFLKKKDPRSGNREQPPLSPPNSLLLDNKAIPPTKRDRYLSNNGIPTWETRIADLMKGDRGAASLPAVFGIAALSGAAGGAAVFFILDKVFAAETTESIDSFPNSFNNDSSVPTLKGLPPHLEQPELTNQVNPPEVSNSNPGSVPEKETKKVKSEDIFDPYAERQVITLKNIVFMPPEEYKNIVPTIDPEHPERVNVLFPIGFAEGSGERKIVIEKLVAQFSLTGGNRVRNLGTEDSRQFPVRSTYVIKKGLMPGDKLISPASGMIEGSFRIVGGNEDSDHFRVGFSGITDFKVEKYIPADRVIEEKVKVGELMVTGFRLVSDPVPVEEGETLGTIVKPKKDPVTKEQFEITVSSLVTGEDGQRQGGPAEIMFKTTPDGKLIIPKPR